MSGVSGDRGLLVLRKIQDLVAVLRWIGLAAYVTQNLSLTASFKEATQGGGGGHTDEEEGGDVVVVETAGCHRQTHTQGYGPEIEG